MNRPPYLPLGVALGIIVVAGVAIGRLRIGQRLGTPGVRMRAMPLMTTDGRIAASNSVALPLDVPGYLSRIVPMSETEVTNLPPDTSFGRALYTDATGAFEARATVVLMGTDHTSIHDPSFCLSGSGWNIGAKSFREVEMSQPHPYRLPVRRFDATYEGVDNQGKAVRVGCVYVFWFVADGRVTSSDWKRAVWTMRDALWDQTFQRWAYVSFLAFCRPGDEDEAFQRLSRVIAECAPRFQTAALEP